MAIASLCQHRGRHHLALAYAEKVAPASLSADNLVKLGDIFAAEKRWDRAARLYENVWTTDCRNAAALYLLGDAHLHAGKASEGRRQMQLALLLPMGDSMCRHALIEALKRLERKDEAIQQCKVLLRTAPFQDWAATRAQQDLGNAAERQGDYLTAADCFERLDLILLQSGFFFMDSKDYLEPCPRRSIPPGAAAC